jgi:integrase
VAPRFLTSEQIERLAGQFAAPYGVLVRFTAYTGLRASEVAGLNVGDIDCLHARLYVRRTRQRVNGAIVEHTPKSGSARVVPLPLWLRDDLVTYLEAHPNRGDPGAPLWPGRSPAAQHGGLRGALDWARPFEHAVFYRRMWKPALEGAHLSAVRFHDLRHTYASLMAREGVPPYRVAKYLGHQDATVTLKVYTHLWDDDASADAALLARPASMPDQVTQLRSDNM